MMFQINVVLGVGGWVITKDKKAFFIQNATWKGILRMYLSFKHYNLYQACRIDKILK